MYFKCFSEFLFLEFLKETHKLKSNQTRANQMTSNFFVPLIPKYFPDLHRLETKIKIKKSDKQIYLSKYLSAHLLLTVWRFLEIDQY